MTSEIIKCATMMCWAVQVHCVEAKVIASSLLIPLACDLLEFEEMNSNHNYHSSAKQRFEMQFYP